MISVFWNVGNVNEVDIFNLVDLCVYVGGFDVCECCMSEIVSFSFLMSWV